MSERPPIIAERIPLAPLTSMSLGGPARYFASCAHVDDIRLALEWAASAELPVQVLAGGSNTIFADVGFDGLVLKMGLRGVGIDDDGGEDAVVRAAAGEGWDDLVVRCIEADLSGIECLSGIPGSVGATPMQNVGAYGQEVAQTVVSVRAIDRQSLEEVTFGNEECRFQYRESRFKGEDRGRYLITEVTYCLKKEVRPQLRYEELIRHIAAAGSDLSQLSAGRHVSRAVRQAVLSLRRRKSMVLDPADPNARSVGSFFLNPVLSAEEFEDLQERWRRLNGAGEIAAFDDPAGRKVSAAWLVEHAGFARGTRRLGAAISDHHALAIVNDGGGATAVLGLAAEIATAVHERFGVELQREPDIVA